ncbi:MAG: DUF1573 domain-containing protein [Planctomycetes bacterium]|nr:DUF1573 domain-containing protein [Planctomycetota bacterium]
MRRAKAIVWVGAAGAVGAAAFFGTRALKEDLFQSNDYVAEAAEQIGVRVEPPVIDFGPQEWGETLHDQFVLTNLRDRPIEIEAIETSCDCTSLVDYAGTVIAPGDVLIVEFALETQFGRGTKQREIKVVLASGETISVGLRLDVRGTYDIAPASLSFGEVHLGEDGELAQVVTFTSANGRTVTDVKVNFRWAEAITAEREDRIEILVRLRRELLPPGWSTGALVIVTDDSKIRATTVPISVKGVQDLTPTPSHVFLTGRQKKRAIFVTGSRKKASLVSARCSHPGITASVHGAELELHNSTGRPLEDTVTVFVTDAAGHVGRVLVSTF